jgi:atrophin-1 interacting protein 3 (BAI1-associated protein 1)
MQTFKPTNSLLLNHDQDQSNYNHHNHIQNEQPLIIEPPNKIRNQSSRNIYFTQNPEELKGEFIKTSLLKTQNGFGFTIIGANETNDDFLQIKYIVPDGAAARDAQLRQGDVLVYVNNECVLGYTHQNVVEIFQSIPIGQFVELTVCRGYPLSIDPNDPNIEIMPLAAINNLNNNNNAPLASVDDLASINTSTMLNQHQSVKNNSQENIILDEYYCEEYEELYAPIVKGPKGFGFTIADDSHMNHQKVKQILDRERCVNLRENDILLEINGYDLKNLTHNQVVELLKECIRGQETVIKLKRRKYQITLPQPPSTSSLNNNNNNNNLLSTTTTTTTVLNNGEKGKFYIVL